MPIYEYTCKDCGQTFEVLTTSRSNAEPPTCRHCQSARVNKIISAGSFRSTSGAPPPTTAPAGCSCKSGFS
jgi:putative FmdB family regulatory protein